MSTLEIQDNRELREKTSKWMLWLAIVSIIMFFGAFTSYYIVRKAAGNWLQFEMPQMFWISTAVILISSVTMNMAVTAIKNGRIKESANMLLITLGLGLAFGICQYFGWRALYASGIYFAGSESNAAGSLMYLLSALHLLHVLAGIIYLGVITARTSKGKYGPNSFLGIKLCAIYWHFLDGLWVYLFLFLYFVR
jgi:cytochrome c oxidase subunit III